MGLYSPQIASAGSSPPPPPLPVDVPLPTKDPRNWQDRLPRVQESKEFENSGTDIKPSELLNKKGIKPSRKNGDAIDYKAKDVLNSLFGGPPQWDI